MLSPNEACVLAHLQASQVIATEENADSEERDGVRLQEDDVEIFKIRIFQTLTDSQDREKSMGK